MSNLPWAAQAVSRGFWIFPVEPNDKIPHRIRPDKDYRIRWGEAATNGLAKVVEWWTFSPQANIGIAAKPSGLLVIDCDVAKEAYALKKSEGGKPWAYLHDKLGPLVDGDDVLREMCFRFGGAGEYDRLMQTYRVCTASMGAHVYLRWPDGVQASQASPAPGALDIRCNGGDKGGYVLGPGSTTEKGHYLVEHEAPIMDATDFPWLVELCRERPRPVKVKSHFSNAAGTGALSGLIDTVRCAGGGNVNHSLYWAASVMRDDGITEEKCVEHLAEVYAEAGGRGGERQAFQTIRSAYQQGAQ